jgi:hypothetical protein
VISGILYVLASTIGKLNGVVSTDSLSIRIFCGFKICSSILILNTISVVIRSWLIYRFMISWNKF